MLLSALYYPHLRLDCSNAHSERLLKRALLLWDELYFIVPERGYPRWYDDTIREAMDLIAKDHCPTDKEMKGAHADIEELLTRPHLPEAFFYKGSAPFEIFVEKFLPETWDLLRDAKVVDAHPTGEERSMSLQAGLTVMSVLADHCAGTTLARVTDRGQAYAALGSLLRDPDSDLADHIRDRLIDMSRRAVSALDASWRRRVREGEELITLRLPILDVDSLTFEQLINFRKREIAEAGHTLRDLRQGYAKHLEGKVKEIIEKRDSEADVRQIEREFEQACRDDALDLQKELRQGVRDALLSRDVVVMAVAASVAVASQVFGTPIIAGVLSVAGAPVSITGAISAGNKYLANRSSTMKAHPLSYLYELEKN